MRKLEILREFELESGCRGMASSFGPEQGDCYDISVKAGERVLHLAEVLKLALDGERSRDRDASSEARSPAAEQRRGD